MSKISKYEKTDGLVVCGGGRYDGLIAELGGSDVAGIGFAVGIERILMLLENLNVEIPNDSEIEYYVAPMGEKEREKAFEIVSMLRQKGISADLDHMNRGIKAQFKYADKIGAKKVIVIGSDELEKGIFKVKEMSTGSEEFLSIDELIK